MKKTTLIAIGVFAALLAVFFATRQDKVNVGVPKLSEVKIDPEKVTGITLSGARSVKLEKVQGTWKVASPAQPDKTWDADEALVSSALRAFADLRGGDFVSEKKDRHAELEVDDSKGLKVDVRQSDGVERVLIFGKNASTGGTYLREPGRDPVWITRSHAPAVFRKDVNDWRKRKFVEVKPDALARLEVSYAEGDGFTAEKKDGAWTLTRPSPLPKNFRFDPGAVDGLANRLIGLSAQEFADPLKDAASWGLDAPRAQVAIGTTDGGELKVKFGGKPEDEKVPVQIDGQEQVYLVAKWAANGVLKRLEDLRDLSLLSFDSAKVERLAVTAGGKRVVVAKKDGAWTLVEPKKTPEGFEFDPAQVAHQLSMLRNLKGKKMAEKPARGRPDVVVEVTPEGGAVQRLELYGDNQAKGSVDALTYEVDGWMRSRFSAGLDLFKKPPPPPTNAMQGLEGLDPRVRAQLEAAMRARN